MEFYNLYERIYKEENINIDVTTILILLIILKNILTTYHGVQKLKLMNNRKI